METSRYSQQAVPFGQSTGVSIVRSTLNFDGDTLSVFSVTPAARVGKDVVVLLHGAGTASKERTLDLALDFAGYGRPVIALDFAGHGESTGMLKEQSLARRFGQARALIEHYAQDDELLLVGFSMSGQTAADLIEHYDTRVIALGLCSPALYAREAWNVPFNAGFAQLIRRHESWRTSSAYEIFRHFTGRAVLATPAHDDVIPDGVFRLITKALQANAAYTRLRFPGAGHQLGVWFKANPADRQTFIRALLD